MPIPIAWRQAGRKARQPGQPKTIPKGTPIPMKPGQPNVRARPRPPPMPEIVKKHFEAKHGFANYYFNKLQQERVWKAWTARADFAGLGGDLDHAGQWDGGGKVRFRPDRRRRPVEAPQRGNQMGRRPGAGLVASAPGSGGLMPALYLWRRLALEGIKHFGQVEYLGTAPLAGHDGLADVLVGTCKGVECWFYFDPAQGDLLALEMYPGEERRSLRSLFLRLSRRGRPAAAGADGSPHRRWSLRRLPPRAVHL